jgi:HSP20 family protein
MKLAKREKRDNGALARTSRAWSPSWPVSRLRDQIDRLFEEPFAGLFSALTPLFEGGWSPAVDFYEDKENVFVKAELPGMKKEDIEVSVSNQMLHISGERKEESEDRGTDSYRAERYFGSFQRNIPLPTSVADDKIHAEYKDGVLTITCPKTEEAKRKQIAVKVE